MATQDQDDYEDLDQTEEEDRGDNFNEEDEEDTDESEDTDEEQEDESGDDEDQEDEEEDEPAPKSKKDIKIPKSRLDEVIRQREEARERNLWLEEQLEKLIAQATSKRDEPAPKKEAPPPYDFDTAEEEYISLVIEGEVAKAAKLRGEINRARQEETSRMIEGVRETALNNAKQEGLKAVQEESFGTLVAAMESKYSFLDHKSDDYNEDAVETVNALLSGDVSKGQTKSEALKRAIDKVAPMFVKEKPAAKPSLGDKRTVDAGKKAVKAAKSQPANIKSTSTKQRDLNVTSVASLTEKDFEKLTEREKRILRGD
jgi:hypothetical protein